MTGIAASPTTRNGPVFIVGAPRSGTTLLQYRLRNHPRISLPTGESHFFMPLYRDQHSFGDLSRLDNVHAVLAAMYRQSRNFLETDLHGLKFEVDRLARELHTEGRQTVRDLIAGLFEKNAQGEGKARWGDKTPYYVLHIPKLLEWFPDAQIVHLIRDGRDVALSLMGRKHDFRIYNAYCAAEYWKRYVDQGREFGQALSSKQDCYYEIRYEDLLNQPEKSMLKLCNFLGEEFTSHLFDVKPVENPGKTPLVHQPIQPENAGKWRNKMSSWEIRAFESVAGDTLNDFRYELVSSANLLYFPMPILYKLQNKILDQYFKRIGK